MAEVSKTLKVIRFAPGLKPVIKHLEGQHDQSTHGRWAKAGYSEDMQSRIANMQDMGPSLEDIKSILSGPKIPSMDDLKIYVENDASMYAEATDGIDEAVANEMSDFGWDDPKRFTPDDIERQKDLVYEQMQEKMIEDYINSNDATWFTEAWQRDNGGKGTDPEELAPFFEEVYNFEHTGTTQDGVEVELNTSVQEVYMDADGLHVDGVIQDNYSLDIGKFERRFFIDDNGNVAVEHKLFKIYDDNEEYRGTGLGKEWILNQEAWYTQAGVDHIEVYTGWDGARHWARAGYDFKPDAIDYNLGELADRARQYADMYSDVSQRSEKTNQFFEEFHPLMERATEGWNRETFTYDGIKPMTNDDFPIPAEFANIGYTPGAKSWSGKNFMQNLNMNYVKGLSAEAQTILQGPIDRDGDGMVYDGTAREKPAPKG